jgi:hypothetical protein
MVLDAGAHTGQGPRLFVGQRPIARFGEQFWQLVRCTGVVESQCGRQTGAVGVMCLRYRRDEAFGSDLRRRIVLALLGFVAIVADVQARLAILAVRAATSSPHVRPFLDQPEFSPRYPLADNCCQSRCCQMPLPAFSKERARDNADCLSRTISSSGSIR